MKHSMNYIVLAINNLQIKLNNLSSQKKKLWWEKYMKHVIQFRGVGIPEIRKMQKTWTNEFWYYISIQRIFYNGL